jgi:hypothetical protein
MVIITNGQIEEPQEGKIERAMAYITNLNK